jgi:hypothetical protein
MKNLTRVALVLAALVGVGAGAQQPITIQHIRPMDQRGLNMFEPSKHDTVTFQGTRVVFGGAFRQDFQGLSHQNTSPTQLIALGHGFNNASANLNLDVQLAKGIRVAMTSYLSSRHHNETWVKDGYILMDASPIDNPILNEIMSHTTLKVGHFEVNYGDGHFRRTDNGQAIFNPFVGNYILDAFTTQVGGEVYVHDGWWLAMAGLTNGEVKGATAAPEKRSPAFFGKLGVDGKPFASQPLRVRITASAMSQAKSANQTLYGGDRAGSPYYNVVEPTTATEAANAWSGQIRNPFGSSMQGQMLNQFIKYKGAEFFGQQEWARGMNATVDTEKRKISQQVAEGLYRLGGREQYYLGARYINFAGQTVAGSTTKQYVSRVQLGGGWFVTKNLLAKGEWVNQDYSGFQDIRRGAKFNGFMFSGAVSF